MDFLVKFLKMTHKNKITICPNEQKFGPLSCIEKKIN